MMNQKEQLKRRIEEEREKLNRLLEDTAGAEQAYEQSLVVDDLIEQYMKCD